MRNIVRIVFLTAAFVCVLLNVILKGKAWSLIVLWSLFSIWQLIFSLKLVEYSIFSHITYIFIDTIVLLWLIDRFLAPGWASTVIPIVFFAAMLTMFIIYFVTYDRKHRHLASMLVMFAAMFSTSSNISRSLSGINSVKTEISWVKGNFTPWVSR